MTKIWIPLIAAVCSGVTISAQETLTDESLNPFTYEASYVTDMGRNLAGGLSTGNVFLGMANICVGFNTQNAGWWQGGDFYFKGVNLHGDSPTDKLIGDFQTASNIDAGEHTYIQELWLRQQLGNFQITLGIQDLNASFVAIESGAVFLNSSFGIPSVISDNVPVPIFPLTAPAITTSWEATENITWQNGFFDGKPTDFENNRYNTNWKLNRDEGMIAISEIQLAQVRYLPKVVKAGIYYHSGLTEKNESTGTPEVVFENNYGGYLLIDHQLFSHEGTNRALSFFGQAVFSPTKYNHHHLYFGGGLNYSGIFGANTPDLLGLGIAHAVFNHFGNKSETAIEFCYNRQLGNHFFIQPDIQYIINPAGTENDLENALVAFVRLGLSF